MSEWKEYKLGEVCSRLRSGKNLKSNLIFPEGKYPVWGGNGVRGYTNECNFSGQCCVIGRQGAYCGNVHYYEGEAYMTEHAIVAVGNEQANTYYLACALSLMHLENLSAQSAQPGISVQTLSTQTIILPPIDEQKRISGVLSSLDDKIDLLHRENATLEALAETLFRHYFIENTNPDWKEGKLGDYVTETIGGEWGKETPEEESNMPVRCLRGADVADLNDGLANRAPLRYIKRSKYEKIKPLNGDIILEISGGTDTCSTGRVAYINNDVKRLFDYPIVFSNFCRLLRVDERHSFFVYCFFRYLHKQGEFFNLENGSSGIHNLNYKAALYEMDWSVPTDEKSVIEFNERVKPYFDKINANKKQILSLSSQRDTLLPRLMSGNLKS